MRFPSIALAGWLLVAGCASFHRAEEGAPPIASEPDRSFLISYEATLSDLPVGEKLRLWIPVPHDDEHQRIRDLQIEGPLKARVRTESEYGNTMAYFVGRIEEPTMHFVVSYEVDRWNVDTDLATVAIDGTEDGAEFDRYRHPSILSFVTPQVREEASRLVAGREQTLEKAQAFYDHVLSQMAYDKNHPGWGRGSIEHACSVGKGNCTDFHTYFNALCLAEGITSRFQIGLFGKYEFSEQEYKTGGYHCWAEFRVPGQDWVPVDISEADRYPSRAAEFFGGHTANRVTLSTGRDVVLSPRQEGPPLNYFLYPYAEVGGESLGTEQVRKTSRWRDLSPN